MQEISIRKVFRNSTSHFISRYLFYMITYYFVIYFLLFEFLLCNKYLIANSYKNKIVKVDVFYYCLYIIFAYLTDVKTGS